MERCAAQTEGCIEVIEFGAFETLEVLCEQRDATALNSKPRKDVFRDVSAGVLEPLVVAVEEEQGCACRGLKNRGFG